MKPVNRSYRQTDYSLHLGARGTLPFHQPGYLPKRSIDANLQLNMLETSKPLILLCSEGLGVPLVIAQLLVDLDMAGYREVRKTYALE